jgi:hypothetical protein
LKLNNKGQMKTVEAFLSVLLLFSAFTLTTQILPPSDDDDQNSLESLGYQILLTIDNEGQISKLIDEKNWTGLANRLNIAVPLGVSYNLTIYNSTQHIVNNQLISNGFISDGNIASILYPCVCPKLQTNYYIIRFQVAIVE